MHRSIGHIHFIHREPHSHVMTASVVILNTHLWTTVEKHKGRTDRVVTITISLKLMIMEQVNLYITVLVGTRGISVESVQTEIICTSQLLGHNVNRQHAKLVISYS